MPQTVIASDSFAAGLRSEFLNTYRPHFAQESAKLAPMMRVGIPSTRNEEDFFYWESSAHPRRRIKGDPIPSKPFDGVQYTVVNDNWSMGIEWFKQDLNDDQTRSLAGHARNTGLNFAGLDRRVMYQILRNAVDSQLLGSIPNAPDGVALFNATDGTGADRFGVTGGNIETGSGILTAGAIRQDVFNVIERILRFQDTEGQPLWDESIAGNIHITFNVQNLQVFNEAFLTGRTVGAVGAAAADGLTNVILDSGFTITLVPTQFITDDDWFVFFAGTDHRAIFSQEREGLVTSTQLEGNSDIARKTKVEGIFWDSRRGYGVSLPTNLIQVNN